MEAVDETSKEYIRNLKARLDAKTLKRGRDEHWPFLGHRDHDKQGRIYRAEGKAPWTVPQAVYLVTHKQLPPGPLLPCAILKDCCNPRHSGLAGPGDIADKILKTKRLTRGKKRRPRSTRQSKLTDAQKNEIFWSKDSTSTLADRYGVSPGYIANIRAGRRGNNAVQHVAPLDAS